MADLLRRFGPGLSAVFMVLVAGWLIGMVLILAMVIWVIVKDRDEH